MKNYEITYLIDPSLSETEATSYQEKVRGMIEEEGGVPGKEQSPTRKTLAYPIKKNSEAYLASLDFEAEEEKMKKIGERIKKEKNILRHLLVNKVSAKPTEEKEEQSPKKRSLKPEKAKLSDIDDKIEEIL